MIKAGLIKDLGLGYRVRGSVHYQGRGMAMSRQAWCRRNGEFCTLFQKLLDWFPGG